MRKDDLRFKLAPPGPPGGFREPAAPLRLEHSGRPAPLRARRRGERTPKREALREPLQRLRTMPLFFHHALQVAELMYWALLAFCNAEVEFMKGLLGHLPGRDSTHESVSRLA